MQDIGTNEILQAISNLGINLNKRIDNIEKVVGKIPEMQKDIDDMKELVGNIPQMQKDIDNMKEDIRNLQKSVAVIEVEHGEKIRILFDAVLVNSEKIDMLNQKMDLQISKLQKHDDEIYYLKSKVQGL